MAYKMLDVNAVNDDNAIDEYVGSATEKIHDIIGGATLQISSFSAFSGPDFTGIDENGLESLKTSISSFSKNIEEIVNGFNESASIDEAFKGEMGIAVKDFVTESKKLLIAFVSNIKRDAVEAEKVFTEYKALTTQGKTDMESQGTDEIRANAESIRFDDKL